MPADTERFRNFFEASPTARLLRSQHAPFVIDFFCLTFKKANILTIAQSELRQQLADYQESLHLIAPEALTDSPDRYLTAWADALWLHRFVVAEHRQPQYQLSPFAEEAIRFVESALNRNRRMVGTEGRLWLIFETLSDLVRGGNADPAERLANLRSQREAIDREIDDIESGKAVRIYRPAQIRERFATAMELLRDLQSDFRAVEAQFRRIARDVQERHAVSDTTRGQILGYALDAEDLLKQQDEGVSFFAFVQLILSPVQQARLREHIAAVAQLEALEGQTEEITRLRRMVPNLLAEAQTVTRTTAKLSSTLRRLLDASSTLEHQRLAESLSAIRRWAIENRDRPRPDIGVSIEGEATYANPLARPFWNSPLRLDAGTMEINVVDQQASNELLERFRKFRPLDFRQLRRRIKEATIEGENVRLSQLVASDPSYYHPIEVLGLLQVARDDGHSIDSDSCEVIAVHQSDSEAGQLRLRVPLVSFRPRSINHVIGKPR